MVRSALRQEPGWGGTTRWSGSEMCQVQAAFQREGRLEHEVVTQISSLLVAGTAAVLRVRNWHRRPFVPVRSGVDTRDQRTELSWVAFGCRWFQTSVRSGSSRRQLPIQRCMTAFIVAPGLQSG